jgi:hypothetical protein
MNGNDIVEHEEQCESCQKTRDLIDELKKKFSGEYVEIVTDYLEKQIIKCSCETKVRRTEATLRQYGDDLTPEEEDYMLESELERWRDAKEKK